MSEFDNAFNNASIGSGINKVNVTGKQEESINPQENKKNYGENSTETILQTSVTNAPAEQALRKRGRKKKDAGTVDANSTTAVGHFSCICDSKLIAQVRATSTASLFFIIFFPPFFHFLVGLFLHGFRKIKPAFLHYSIYYSTVIVFLFTFRIRCQEMKAPAEYVRII